MSNALPTNAQQATTIPTIKASCPHDCPKAKTTEHPTQMPSDLTNMVGSQLSKPLLK